jgi:hypothetical protein
LHHGIIAYAEKQADLLDCCVRSYAQYWLPTLKAKDVKPCWEAKYSNIAIAENSHNRKGEDNGAEDDGDELGSEDEDRNVDIIEADVHYDFETDI